MVWEWLRKTHSETGFPGAEGGIMTAERAFFHRDGAEHTPHFTIRICRDIWEKWV